MNGHSRCPDPPPGSNPRARLVRKRGEWTLDKVDEILRGEDGRASGFVQRDDRDRDAWAKNIPLAELALLLRLGRTMLRFPRAYRRFWPDGFLSCPRMPPPFALDVARACGVAVLVGPRTRGASPTSGRAAPTSPA